MQRKISSKFYKILRDVRVFKSNASLCKKGRFFYDYHIIYMYIRKKPYNNYSARNTSNLKYFLKLFFMLRGRLFFIDFAHKYLELMLQTLNFRKKNIMQLKMNSRRKNKKRRILTTYRERLKKKNWTITRP